MTYTGEMEIDTNGSALDKPRLSTVGGIVNNDEKELLLAFWGVVGIGDSSKAKIMAIEEGVKLFLCSFSVPLLIEVDFLKNALRRDTRLV